MTTTRVSRQYFLKSKHLPFLAFLFVMAMAIGSRIFAAFYSGLPWFNTDTYTYFSMADAILNGHPYSYFPNGYPLFVAFIKTLVRPGAVPNILMEINVALSVAVVWMSMKIASKMTESKIAPLLTGLIITFYPNQLNYVRQLLTEVPTTFLLVLGVLLIFKKSYFFSGLVFFLAILFRSSVILIPVLLMALLLLPISNSNKRYSKVAKMFSGFLIGLVLYLSLLAINICKPSNNFGLNLLISIHSTSQQIDFSAKDFTDIEIQHPLRAYLQFALNHPSEYIKQRVSALDELWGFPSDAGGKRSIATRALIAIRIPFLILAIVGLMIQYRNLNAWILFVPIIAVTLVHLATFSSPRFTYVIEPFMIVLSVLVVFDTEKAGPRSAIA